MKPRFFGIIRRKPTFPLDQIQTLLNGFDTDPQGVSDKLKAMTTGQIKDLQAQVEQMLARERLQPSQGAERQQQYQKLRSLLTETLKLSMHALLTETLDELGDQKKEMEEEKKAEGPKLNAFSGTKTEVAPLAEPTAKEQPAVSFDEYKKITDPEGKNTSFWASAMSWVHYKIYQMAHDTNSEHPSLVGRFLKFIGWDSAKDIAQKIESAAPTKPEKPAPSEPKKTEPEKVETPAKPKAEKPATTTPEKPKPTLTTPETITLPATISFAEFKNGVTIGKNKLRVLEPNLIQVNNSVWKIVHKKNYNLKFTQFDWSNNELNLKGEVTDQKIIDWAKVFGRSISDYTKFNREEALELVQDMATKTGTIPLYNDKGTPKQTLKDVSLQRIR